MSGVIKSREMMRWTGYVAHTRKTKREYKILAGKYQRKGPTGDQYKN
jgi:hypothetical protein